MKLSVDSPERCYNGGIDGIPSDDERPAIRPFGRLVKPPCILHPIGGIASFEPAKLGTGFVLS